MRPPRRAARRGGAPVIAAALLLCIAALSALAATPAAQTKKPLTTAEVLAASGAADWRVLDPLNTLYVELPAGRVIIELAPQFAPHHVANVMALARGHYFDGLAIMRAQDNYVVQWGDPDEKKPVHHAQRMRAVSFRHGGRPSDARGKPPDARHDDLGSAQKRVVARPSRGTRRHIAKARKRHHR